jgi:hypothetical protein
MRNENVGFHILIRLPQLEKVPTLDYEINHFATSICQCF